MLVDHSLIVLANQVACLLAFLFFFNFSTFLSLSLSLSLSLLFLFKRKGQLLGNPKLSYDN